MRPDLDLKTPVGNYMVSTVDLSVGHGPNHDLFYETYIFPQKDGKITRWLEVWGTRYPTEDEARKGHDRVVSALEDGTLQLDEEPAA